jgi:hypothetical protein
MFPDTLSLMGTWGEGAFDNDSAADWAWNFDHADLTSGTALIEETLGQAAGIPADDYLSAREGALAVAAAELVAYISGQPADETAYNRSAFGWADRVDAVAGAPLISLALRALDRVTTEQSELANLWDEAPSTWRTTIAELTAKLQDASADSPAEHGGHPLLPSHLYQSAVNALAAIPAADISGIYAVSFFIWNQEQDPRRPALTIGYNTETQIQQALASHPAATPGPPSDEAEARWNYAYWLQNELAVIGDDTRDPVGAELTETWIKARGLWYSEPDGTTDEDWADADAAAEQIDDYFADLYARTARHLHDDGVISRTFGRPIPILIHELEYPDWVADLTEDANPPGLADTFTTWTRALGEPSS